MPVFPSYRNQSIDLTGFYARATLSYGQTTVPLLNKKPF